MYKEHPVFEKPENDEATIWRYLDFTKFVSLLDKSALFFSRADRLDDPFEGSLPKANIRLRPLVYKDEIPADAFQRITNLRKHLVKCTAVNCWHLNEYESAPMWKLYLKSNEGIAVKSTFNRLRSCFKDEKRGIYIGKVQYIDYEKDWLPEGNLFYPFVHKRKSFEHEQELRAVIQEYCYKEGGDIDWSKSPFEDGIYIQVDLNILMDKIYLAPTSPKWLFELIKSVSKRYELDKEVHQSTLDDVPAY